MVKIGICKIILRFLDLLKIIVLNTINLKGVSKNSN